MTLTLTGLVTDGSDNTDVRVQDEFSGGAEFFEMSLDLLCVAGFDGYLKRVNPAWTRALGWTSEELLSRPSIEFVYPEDRDATLKGRAGLKANEPLIGFVNRYLCKDGSHRWLEWRSIAHPERQVVYATARDVTEQREAERQLQEAKESQERMQRQLILSDRLASVGMLAAGVAHEINNPLSFLSASLELLAEELDHQSDSAAATTPQLASLRETVREAREGSERIRKIVRGLKTLSRVEQERRSAIELRPVLELSINMTSNEIRHRARLVKTYGDTPQVMADEARLAQVFINLLVNAAQAIPEGTDEEHEISVVTSSDAAGRAVIDVLDSGPGISPQVLPRIFDPFFTTKAFGVGTGLGLSICHGIVTGLGGEITASNREPRGARLRVVLPAAQRAAETVSAPEPEPATKSSGTATVLVVDDERAVGMILARTLANHHVTVVTSAREALRLIRGGSQFDLILSDLMMPELSGADFYEVLLRENPELAQRMVFMSGGAFTPQTRAFLERVANARLEKPFQLSAVRELVQKFVP